VNRSFKSSLIDAVLQPNRSLWILLGSVVALLGLAVYWPPLQMLFRFGALHWNDIAICFGASALTIIALEMLKARWFRTESRHNAPAPAQQGNPTA
jgi:Ca2+-transporting ATPase